VATVVAGFREAAQRVDTDRLRTAGHRLEHLEMIDRDQLAELGRLGVIASVQPVFDAWWGGAGGLYETRLGARARGMNPYADMLAAGITLAFGSDSPVTPMSPWLAVRAAVHHHAAGQRLDARTAVEAHTAGGWRAAEATARATGSDGSTLQKRRLGGLVAEGAPAYLAVWDAVWDAGRDAGKAPGRDAGLEEIVAPGRELPRCELTIVEGMAAHDVHDEWPRGDQR
jgi:predicted amidohydrolase YtcJ